MCFFRICWTGARVSCDAPGVTCQYTDRRPPPQDPLKPLVISVHGTHSAPPLARAAAQALLPLNTSLISSAQPPNSLRSVVPFPILSPRPARGRQELLAPPHGPGAVQRLRVVQRRRALQPLSCLAFQICQEICLLQNLKQGAPSETPAVSGGSAAETGACLAYKVVYGLDFRAARASPPRLISPHVTNLPRHPSLQRPRSFAPAELLCWGDSDVFSRRIWRSRCVTCGGPSLTTWTSTQRCTHHRGHTQALPATRSSHL